jgi:rare lipoprotein A
VKVGKPYVVFGVTYYPADDRDYDEKGIASWYGPGFHRGPTANGETYNQDDLTAAHKTLPLPSWVEVTNLDNGRQLVVRINDRGPFVDGRIIDLSRRSAQLLGVDGPGLARVRVRRVYPAGDWALNTPPLKPAAPLLAATSPAKPLAASPAGAAPPPAPAPAAPSAAPLFVQVAAVGDAGRAQYLASELSDIAPGRTSPAPNGLWRVRLGPFTSEAEASDVMARLAARGFAGARLVREVA